MAQRLAVVMAGGSGERFWPLSRPGQPKQLLKLTSPDETMLEEAVNRLIPLVGGDHVFISTSKALAEPISEAGVVPTPNILAEPIKRNTLGALVWTVASLVAAGFEDATIAVVTADHLIGEPEKFRQTVAVALEVAEQTSGLVTIGITPDRAETGYGYIETSKADQITLESGRFAYRASSFREKPDQATAEEFVSSGNFYWNAGMFFFTVEGFKKEFKQAQPEVADVIDLIADALQKSDHNGAELAFARLPNLAFDYAVMERAKTVHCVPSDFPWDDVGAWDAIERSHACDDLGNVARGSTVMLDAKGCIVVNESSEFFVGLVGVENVVVVATEHGVLVCDKSQVQRVRDVARKVYEVR